MCLISTPSSRSLPVLLAFLLIGSASALSAAPNGGRITQGQGDISNPFEIEQNSAYLGTSWERFDIAENEVVTITQPSASALISIKVRNGVETNINGTLNANGRVSLENPAGIQFSAGSVVNVGGLLATAGAVRADGVITAPSGEVHFQSLSNNGVVNVAVNIGGAVEAQRIIVEGAGEVRLGSSAVLTANKEVLVGGGFQGKGDIANAQKTIVESGALITSPRVIIWSDVSTNFQGSINAEGGFVEVSGKQHLASFDIFKVKAAKLLLDPREIHISNSENHNSHLEGDGEVKKTDGTDNGNQLFNISTKAVEDYDGDVSLVAKESITINDRAINKTNGGLTLIAPAISIFYSISVSGDLTLRGPETTRKASVKNTIQFSSSRDVTLSGRNITFISLAANPSPTSRTLTISASNIVTLGGILNKGLGGDITITSGPDAPINFISGVPTYILGRNITLYSTWGTATPSNEFLLVAAAGSVKLQGHFNTGENGDMFIASGTNHHLGEQNPNPSAIFFPNSLSVASSATPATVQFAGNRRGTTLTGNNITLLSRGDDSSTGLNANSIQGISIAAAGRVELGGFFKFSNPFVSFSATSGPSSAISFIQDTNIAGARTTSLISRGGTPRVFNSNVIINPTSALLIGATIGGVFDLGTGDFTAKRAKFSNKVSTFITAGDIDIRSNTSSPPPSNQDLILRSLKKTIILRNISIGTGTLTLSSTKAEAHFFADDPAGDNNTNNVLYNKVAIFFTGSNSFTIADWLLAKDSVSITATQANIIMPTAFDNAAADLSIIARIGSLVFDDTAPTTINAKTITLVSRKADQRANTQNLMVTSAGELTLGGGFARTTGNISFAAGTNSPINISSSHVSFLSIKANDISLTSSGGGSTPMYRSLVVEAAGTATISGDFKLNGGITILAKGAVTLGGSLDAGSEGLVIIGANRFFNENGALRRVENTTAPLNFSTTTPTSITAGTIRLLAADGSTPTATTQPLTLNYTMETFLSGTLALSSNLTIAYSGTPDLAIADWMIATGRSLSITATQANIATTLAEINIGGGDLILNTQQGVVDFSGTTSITAKNISITSTGTNTDDNRIIVALTLAATQAITLNKTFRIARGKLVDPVSNTSNTYDGSITFNAPRVVLGEDSFNLMLEGATNDGHFAFQSGAALSASSIAISYNAYDRATQQTFTIPAWAAISGTDLSVATTTLDEDGLVVSIQAEIIIPDGFDIGSGTLSLESIAFSLAPPASGAASPPVFGEINITHNNGVEGFTIPAWAIASGKNLSVTQLNSGTILIPNDLDIGSATLSLAGGEFAPVVPEEATAFAWGALKLNYTNSADENRSIPSWAIKSNIPLSVTSLIDVIALDGLNIGSGALTLDATGFAVRGTIAYGGSLNITYRGTDDFQISSWVRSDRNLTITATEADIIVPTSFSFDFGTNNLTLIAEKGNLNFPDLASEIIARNITLISLGGTPTTINTHLTITASGFVLLGGTFDRGRGAFSVTAGASQPINFVTTHETRIAANFVTLISNGAPTASNQDLTIIDSAQITLGGSFDAGTGDITLTADSIIDFSDAQATSLNARNIALTSAADSAPTASNQALTLTAAGSLTLNGAFNIGTGTLTLTASADNPIYLATDRKTSITAGDITLAQAIEREATLELTHGGSGDYTIPSWAIAANKNLAVNNPVGSITIPDNLNLGSGSLTLTASGFAVEGNTRTWGRLNAVYTGASAFDIPDWMLNSGKDLTLIATEAGINIPASITFGSNRLGLIAEEGALVFAADTTLSAYSLTLISADDSPTASNNTLTIEDTIDIVIGGTFNFGTGDIIITANRAFVGAVPSGTRMGIAFSPNIATTLKAANITLNSSSTLPAGSGQAVTLEATAKLTLTGLFAAGLESGNFFTLSAAELDADLTDSMTPRALAIVYTGTGDTGASVFTIPDWAKTTIDALSITYEAGKIIVPADFDISLGHGRTALSLRAMEFELTDNTITYDGALSLTYLGTTAFDIPNWLVYGEGDLSITATEANIGLPADIDNGLYGLALIAEKGALVFDVNGASSISAGGDISLRSAAAQATASGQSLTLTAAGDVSLMGNINIGAGELEVNAGNNGGIGVILFGADGADVVLAAAAVRLSQNGAPFAAEVDATFTIPSSGKPSITNLSGQFQAAHSWFAPLPIKTITFSVNDDEDGAVHLLVADFITANAADFGALVVDENGVLDFSNFDITLITETGSIIFPIGTKVIKANSLMVRVGSNSGTIFVDDGTGGLGVFPEGLTINVNNHLELPTIHAQDSHVALTARTISLNRFRMGGAASKTLAITASEGITLETDFAFAEFASVTLDTPVIKLGDHTFRIDRDSNILSLRSLRIEGIKDDNGTRTRTGAIDISNGTIIRVRGTLTMEANSIRFSTIFSGNINSVVNIYALGVHLASNATSSNGKGVTINIYSLEGVTFDLTLNHFHGTKTVEVFNEAKFKNEDVDIEYNSAVNIYPTTPLAMLRLLNLIVSPATKARNTARIDELNAIANSPTESLTGGQAKELRNLSASRLARAEAREAFTANLIATFAAADDDEDSAKVADSTRAAGLSKLGRENLLLALGSLGDPALTNRLLLEDNLIQTALAFLQFPTEAQYNTAVNNLSARLAGASTNAQRIAVVETFREENKAFIVPTPSENSFAVNAPAILSPKAYAPFVISGDLTIMGGGDINIGGGSVAAPTLTIDGERIPVANTIVFTGETNIIVEDGGDFNLGDALAISLPNTFNGEDVTGDVLIKADTIAITTTRETASLFSASSTATPRTLTLEGTSPIGALFAIQIFSPFIDFSYGSESGTNVILKTEGVTSFLAQDVITVKALNITFDSEITRADTAEVIGEFNFIATQAIHFSTGKSITILANGDLTLTSPQAGIASNRSLSLHSVGTLTLDGRFSLGSGSVLLQYAQETFADVPEPLEFTATTMLVIPRRGVIFFKPWMAENRKTLWLGIEQSATTAGINLPAAADFNSFAHRVLGGFDPKYTSELTTETTIEVRDDINLGDGDLRLFSNTLRFSGKESFTITANDITIHTKTAIASAGGLSRDLALNAAGDIRLTSTATSTLIHRFRDLTLLADGEINILSVAHQIFRARDITLSGTIAVISGNIIPLGGGRAPILVPTSDKQDISFIARGVINFATDRANSISAAALILVAGENAPTLMLEQDFTLTASEAVTLINLKINLPKATTDTKGATLTIEAGSSAALSLSGGNFSAEVVDISSGELVLEITLRLPDETENTTSNMPTTIDAATFKWELGNAAFPNAVPDDLKLTFSSALELINSRNGAQLTIQDWMVVEDRSLSITITDGGPTGITITDDITLGTGDLTLISGGNINIRFSHPTADSTITLSANNITIRDNSSSGVNENNNTSYALLATNDILLTGASFNFGRDITIMAGNDLLVNEENTSIIGRVVTIDIGGEVKAGDTNFFLNANTLTLANDKPTTITGNGTIEIESLDAGAVSNQNLTIEAGGDLTLIGKYDVGINTDNSIVRLTSTNGTIIFNQDFNNSGVTINARDVILTQETEVFTPTQADNVTFTLSANDDNKPLIRYIGNDEQTSVDWARQFGANSDTHVTLMDHIGDGNTFGEHEGTGDDINLDISENDNEAERDFIVTAGEKFIVPAGDINIKAQIIIIRADSIQNAADDEDGIENQITLIATQRIVLHTDIASSENIIIQAPEVVFSSSKPVKLNGNNIMIDVPDDMVMPEEMPATNNQNVALTAVADIQINNNINVGFGTLTLKAGGKIEATERSVSIAANRVVYEANTATSESEHNITIESMNDIRLLSSIETNGNIILRAGGSIITPDADTSITADGAGNNLIFEQRHALRQNFALTLKAGGDVSVIGDIDRGTGAVMLTAGGAVMLVDTASIRAATISISQSATFGVAAPAVFSVLPALTYSGTTPQAPVSWAASLTCTPQSLCQ